MFNDLDGPLTRFSRSQHIYSRISQKLTRQSSYITLIGNHTQSTEWYHFQLPWFTLDRDLSTLNISEMTRDRAIVTTERQQDVICVLSNGDIFNDLHGPLTRFSRSWHFWSQICKKNGASYGQSYCRILIGNHIIVYRMIPLSMILSDIWPRFQGHDIFWSRISENRRVSWTMLQ